MRDPARIDDVLTKLRAYWLSCPDLRLGQLVLNALRDRYGAVNASHAFNAEDVELVAGLEAMVPCVRIVAAGRIDTAK